jgi:hypothetical protein
MTILITLVLPPGGDAGPFNLYSNLDGYVAPFATNVSAAALQAGYTALFVPDGTTTIRVQSVGVCTNFINVQVNVLPTTTTTSSTSTSSTSTTTSTSTTAVPTTTTTSSSTSTSTSSTTTTTTTCPCYIWDVNPTAPDVAAGLDVTYIKCNGALTVEQDVKIAGIDICVKTGEGTPILSRDVPGEITSTVTQTSECCSPTPVLCYVYQVNGDPTPAATPETPRAEHIVEYVDCVTNTIQTVIAYGAGYGGVPERTIENICAIQILADSDEPLTDLTGSCTPAFTTTTTTTNAGFLYYRTQNGPTTPYAGDGCILDLDQSCKLQHQNPNPSIVTNGDRVTNSPGSGYFDGGGDTYRLQISTASFGDPSYEVTIDALGYVNILSTCT